ncbi:MAG: hypothetical protein JXB42_12035 [Deltaproteobacteria bacterium]|nr:hypothetical protein [Deltaproteobacteria bacterium]
MNKAYSMNRLETLIVSNLERIPLVSFYVRTRGWHYVLSWCHRITAIILVLYLWFHLYTLSSLHTPEVYNWKMGIMFMPVVVFFAWLSSVPVIFHALNGGRLILYESFGDRNDESMVRWTLYLCFVYVAILGILIFMENQTVSAIFFWLVMIVASLAVTFGVAAKIWKSQHTVFWKMQRITGAFLLIAVPAHLLFSHLNPSVAIDAQMVIARMQNWFIKIVDLLLAFSVIYHSGYGLFSIAADYIRLRILRIAIAGVIVLLSAIFLIIALRIVFTI